ncbi:hypothetical protein [Longispora urticae]
MSLDDLDDSQLGQILQHLVARFDDDEPAVTEHEIDERVREDLRFLTEAAAHYGVQAGAVAGVEAGAGAGAGDRPSLLEVVRALEEAYPENGPVVEAAAERARRVGTLPLSDIAGEILVIAAAAAVLRPKLTIRRSRKGEDREFTFQAEAGGGKGANSLLTTVLNFLGRGPTQLP